MSAFLRRPGSRDVLPSRREPIGVRQNNPLNLIWLPPGRAYDGQLAERGDNRFGTYRTPEDGIRAAVKQIIKIVGRSRDKSIVGLISIWAPKTDNNDPDAYAATVAAWMSREMGEDITPTTPIPADDGEFLFYLARAMAKVENGYIPWDDATWRRGVAAAGFAPPRRERLTDSRTIRAGGLGLGAGAASVASFVADYADYAAPAAESITKLNLPWLQLATLLVCIACLGLTIWFRYQDWKDGYR